jgi:hypothetical protein
MSRPKLLGRKTESVAFCELVTANAECAGDSSVDIMTRWTARVRFSAGAGEVSLLHSFNSASGPIQHPLQWVQGPLFPGRKVTDV